MYLRNGKCTSEPPTRRQTKLTRRRLLQEMTPQSSLPPTQPPNDSTPNNNSTPTSDPTTPSSPTRSPPSSPPPSPPPSPPSSPPFSLSPPSSPPPSPPPSPTSPPSSPPSSPPHSPPYFLASPTPSPPRSPPTPPLPPLTKWRCRTCNTLYPIAATRRCLSSGCNTLVWASMLISRRQGLDPVNSKKPRRRLEWPIRPDLPLRRGRKRPAQRRDSEILFGYEAWEARSEWRR